MHKPGISFIFHAGFYAARNLSKILKPSASLYSQRHISAFSSPIRWHPPRPKTPMHNTIRNYSTEEVWARQPLADITPKLLPPKTIKMRFINSEILTAQEVIFKPNRKKNSQFKIFTNKNISGNTKKNNNLGQLWHPRGIIIFSKWYK